MSKKNRKSVAAVASPVSGAEPAQAEVIQLPVDAVEQAPAAEARVQEVEPATDHASSAIGWTPEHTLRLKWYLKGLNQEADGEEFANLCMEIDRDVGHFVAGIIALGEGKYDLAGLNLWNARMIEKAPSVVEEEEVD